MPFSLPKTPVLMLVNLLVWAQVVRAQSEVEPTKFSTVEYQDHDTYYERITYVGKRRDIFIVDTYLKDSTLYRVDNYRMLDQGIHFGFYAVRHGPSKIFYSSGQLYLACDYNMNQLNGPFVVYNSDGSIKRRELYRNGRLKKGLCYDADGQEYTCEAFYQNVKFTGNRKELKAYLENNFQSLLTEDQSLLFTVSLIINEVGQVITIKAGVGRSNARLLTGIKKVIQDMPRWHENESNWKPAYMDGVPVPGSWDIQVYRERNSYWRISFPEQ